MINAKNSIRALALLLLTGLAVSGWASERGTSRQAMLLLENAAQVLEKEGPERAFAQFNDAGAGFVQSDLYLFAIDLQGTYLASGANPKLVGSSLAEVSDATGKPIGQEILKLAKLIGYGIVEYEWLNRQTNKVEHKFSRIRKVGDYVIGVGFYLPEAE